MINKICGNLIGKYKYTLKVGVVFVFLSSYAAQAYSADLDLFIKQCRQSYSKVSDFSCMFHKKERLKDELVEEKYIIFKFKKPASYYYKYTEGVGEGAEAIYVHGKYENKLKIHLGKFLGFINLSLDPGGWFYMKYNRHTVFESDFSHIIDLIENNYNKAKTNKEVSIEIKKEYILDGRQTYLIKAVFPRKQCYYGHIIYIYLDKQLMLPIKIEVYGWDNELLEMYYYSDIKINNCFSDMEFDIKNPAYGF
ncbi:MAG: DUF1571 domain-containing protein [Proteobacteria bacterium]|nr:DUF1571 domain-containing protein [Pseudomonadota bacterium]